MSDSKDTVTSFVTNLFVMTVILAGLKFLQIMECGWWWVFSPIWMVAFYFVILYTMAFTVVLFKSKK